MFDTTEGKGKKALSFRLVILKIALANYMWKEKNICYRFGKKQIIPGIEEVLSTMRVGGERTCTIPAKYAYGSKGVCLQVIPLFL